MKNGVATSMFVLWVGSRTATMFVLMNWFKNGSNVCARLCGRFDDALFLYGTDIGSRICMYIGVYGLHSTYSERRGCSLSLERQWE